MDRIVDYLMREYFEKLMPGVQGREQLALALDLQKDKVVAVYDNGELVGVAVFLTLEDDTFMNIENIDLLDVNVLAALLKERGRNIHFIILTAKCIQAILAIGREVYRNRNPRSVSWWDSKRKILHRRNFN